MEWTGLNDLREKFLSFFESKGHLRLPSFPLIPRDDSSLLLINSGMAPLKKYFLGLEEPPRHRVTTCQKCIRTPDIERVGKTSRHGTFFEMLGNFSFGDYFKNEATAWAWEFITQVLKIPTDRLWVSIYQDDDQAFDIWTKQVGVSPDRIVRLGKEDNFWEIGTGPCGPCSEIYYDRGEEFGCGKPDCAVGCDCDRYVEFWNLVFTQFTADEAGNYTPLEHPNIDTGMGLERLACIMQGVDNLFEVDTIQNIMKHVSRIAGVQYKEDEKTDVSLRIITDHIRSTTFLIADGVIPSNEGRGYVLRRLLRRAARHGRLIGITEPFLYQVCDTVIGENRTAYPELTEKADYIKRVVQSEEERFAKTIGQGMELLNSILDRMMSDSFSEKKVLSGEQAFRLYDTFGFPIDLTREIISEKQIDLDEDEFAKLMDEQRTRARTARENSDVVGWAEDVFAQLEGKETFVGYEKSECNTVVKAVVKEGELADYVGEGEEAVLVLEQTPFYAESGGQVGDHGIIVHGKNLFRVCDCKKSPTGHILHIGRMESGFLSAGDEVNAVIDTERRRATMANHTACHLLQAALRSVLGNHVHQAGSLVDPDRCRFDFSHFSAVTPEELAKVEALVNDMIFAALPVSVQEMPIAEAKKLGAMALFGEKYGDVVRVCNVSEKSIEFCGGTHVDNTSKIGLFKILSESSVAAGVRRIEATTSKGVLRFIDELNDGIAKAAAPLKVHALNELAPKVAALAAEVKEKEHQVEELRKTIADFQVKGLFENAMKIDGVKLICAAFSGTKPDTLRIMADKVRENAPYMVAVISGVYDGKATLAAACGKEAVAMGVHAGKLIKQVCQMVGGSGGGRPDSAMGGASDLFKIDEALAQVPDMVRAMLKQEK